jgi:adenylate cyclase
MKSSFQFRSIQTRIVIAVSLLVVMVVGSMVGVWASTEQELYRTQKIQQAESFALAFGQGLQGELSENNWANMRLKMNTLMRSNNDFVYAIASDSQEQNLVVAAFPANLNAQFIPDVVPLAISENALQLKVGQRSTSSTARISETYLLRDVEFPVGTIRGRKGERIIEAAVDIPKGNNLTKINGTFRVGITLRNMEAQIWNAIRKTLVVGGVALIISIIAAYYLAWHLSQPILALRQSAARIAAGDLEHRVPSNRRDELGALARSFNNMSDSLQLSFGRLQQTLESFERFVPEKFLHVIAPRGIENIAVGEYAKRKMTILFSDIRGYTSLSESQTPEETFKFLNEYIAYVGAAIDQEGGFIDKYIGDAVMALFDEVHTDGALRAAIGMQQALDRFNQKREQQGFKPVAIGVGLHRGEVVMGTVGFTSRIDSTVIGDAVNVSSRVEGLTKEYGCGILVTDAVVSSLADRSAFDLQLVAESVKVKGKEATVGIYRLGYYL